MRYLFGKEVRLLEVGNDVDKEKRDNFCALTKSSRRITTFSQIFNYKTVEKEDMSESASFLSFFDIKLREKPSEDKVKYDSCSIGNEGGEHAKKGKMS